MSLHFRDHELKVITERINLAERNFSTLLKDFVAFSAGLQSLQEKGMKLSRSVDMYSDEEYPSMKASLAGVSESIAAIQDFLGAQVSCLTLQYLICLHLKGLMSFVTISCLAYCCSMSVGCRSDLYLPSVNYIFIYFIRLHESAVLLHTGNERCNFEEIFNLVLANGISLLLRTGKNKDFVQISDLVKVPITPK